MSRLLAGIFIVAAVSAAGDYVWYEIGVRHRMLSGVIHGAVLLTAVGGTLGAAHGRTLAGLPMGTVAGVAGALVYYALFPVLRGWATLAAWASLWIMLAVIDGRVVRRVKRSAALCLIALLVRNAVRRAKAAIFARAESGSTLSKIGSTSLQKNVL